MKKWSLRQSTRVCEPSRQMFVDSREILRDIETDVLTTWPVMLWCSGELREILTFAEDKINPSFTRTGFSAGHLRNETENAETVNLLTVGSLQESHQHNLYLVKQLCCWTGMIKIVIIIKYLYSAQYQQAILRRFTPQN